MPRGDKQRSGYHHGDLRRVLIEEAIALLNERGVEGFSVREVARRAQVAPAAPSHHFGNATGLLTAVAEEGFRKLVARSRAIHKKACSPVERVVLIGEAYVRFARRNPGIFSILFRSEALDNTQESFCDVRTESLLLLRQAVREAVSKDAPDDRVDWLTNALWAMVHGMATLQVDQGATLRERVGLATRAMLAGSDVIA
ncbi:MAG: TetR/AcrR family transcriptional regulator [Myxococcota bacterium]